MKLFWKIFVSMFFSFVVIVTSTSYIISVKQISDVERNIIEERQILGSFIAKEVEVGYFESKWPFESLKKLSEYKGFLFWWIVRDDGTIHLADNTSFMGTNAHDYFPQITNLAEKEKVSLNRDQNCAIFFKPLETGKNKWSFWFGFSLREVSERRAEIIFLITAVSMSALGALGVILFFAIKHFTKPVKELTLGATTIGKGDLTYRVKIESKDELGQLADTFNKMTEDLQKTTVSKDYVNNIIDSMMDVLIVVDPGGKIRTVNKATCDLLGYKENDLIGQSMETIFLTPGEIPAQKNILEKLNEKDDTRNYETYFKAKEGRKIPVILSSSVMRNSNTTCVVLIGKDITEKKKAEEERTALEEKFRQSQKMEAIGRLAGGIAHDFNNLLTIMRGHSQLALMDLKEGDQFRETFEAIDKATTKSANLVRQILAFSRRQVMEMIVLDLNNLLGGLEKMLRRIIGEDIELLTVLADDLGKVKADPGQIEQVIMNLAVNARDAMPSGGKLTIETANVELDEAYARRHVAVTPGLYVMLSVSDMGVGMTPEIRERVFEPFFTTKEKGKGTGLGLATVYGIVKQSGGNIWVYSESGQGTTFKIYLPRVDEPLTKAREEEVSGLFRGVGVILVAEDEEMVRKVVLEGLKKQGYSVLEAANEEDALLICQQYKDTIHLLVTDVVMPMISGPELAKRLVVFHPEMKVLYMSGYPDEAIVQHGVLKRGMNYIQKPFTLEGLARKVRVVLDKDTKPAT